MNTTFDSVDGALLAQPGGRIDSNTAGQFEQELLTRIEAGEARVVLDFSALDYISSAGLRVVLMAAKRTQAAQGALALCGLNESIREVFEISGFLSILTVCEGRDEALLAVTGG